MPLIWAEGFIGKKALAPLWREFAVAQARQNDETLSDEQRGAAFVAAQAAEKKYAAATSEAIQALGQRALAGQARTHVLIVGIGKYDDTGIIPTVSTSVHGARAFADWMLTRFVKHDRPLGSLALLTSPAPDQGDWTPSAAAAARLGLTAGSTLPTKTATFADIKSAFGQFLERAGTLTANAAIFYFSGHGVFKSEPLVLAQDARLPSDSRAAANIIATVTTMHYMQQREPSIQCFFIDACSEKNFDLIQNAQELPGEPLVGPVNAAEISERDANIYWGSYPGGKARGPENAAPFFTQELLHCLDRRASDPFAASEDPATPSELVTAHSLAEALAAAGGLCSERESTDVKFPHTRPGQNTFNARLCEISGSIEVLVRIDCTPNIALGTAKLYVQVGTNKISRSAPRDRPWCTTVPKGDFTAGADFDPPSDYNSVVSSFPARPPVHDVHLKARGAGAAGGKS